MADKDDSLAEKTDSVDKNDSINPEDIRLEDVPSGKAKKKEQGVAATLDEDEPSDQALLSLAPRWWFKVFLIFSGLLALSEPFLVAFPHYTHPVAQKVVLAVSTALFVLGYGLVMGFMPEGNLWQRFVGAFLSETWIEVFSFAIGWGLIFQDPGMASIRCFRIFRFVWYAEFYRAKKGRIFYPITFLCQLVLQYLEKIGSELFSTNSKGGIVVLGFFFYMAYVLGVSFWQKTANEALTSPEGGPTGTLSECDTLPHCFLIMLRLTFWDGSGFDFLKSIMDRGDKGQVTLLIFYMCFSAMVLLNGLIGIFGGAFQAATQEDEDEEEKEEEEGEKENKQVLEALGRIEEIVKKLGTEVNDLKKKTSLLLLI